MTATEKFYVYTSGMGEQCEIVACSGTSRTDRRVSDDRRYTVRCTGPHDTSPRLAAADPASGCALCARGFDHSSDAHAAAIASTRGK